MKKHLLFPLGILTVSCAVLNAQTTSSNPGSPSGAAAPATAGAVPAAEVSPASPAMAPAAPGQNLGSAGLSLSGAAGTAGASVLPDGILMQGESAMVTRGGATKPLTETLTFRDGSRVSSDGTFTSADGVSQRLSERQMLTLDGRIVAAPAAPQPAIGEAPAGTMEAGESPAGAAPSPARRDPGSTTGADTTGAAAD